MKLLALERERPGRSPGDFAPHGHAEARALWDLVLQGTVREAYFRDDRRDAVLILECSDIAEAESVLARLPMVHAGLIEFEIIPLRAYDGFERLFARRGASEPTGPEPVAPT
jgi:hypothetical protein